MPNALLSSVDGPLCPLFAVNGAEFDSWLGQQSEQLKTWVAATGFKAKAGETLLVPADEGGLSACYAGIEGEIDLWSFADLPGKLPPGTYDFQGLADSREASLAALGWSLGAYEFTRYKQSGKTFAQLQVPAGADMAFVTAASEAIYLARDLINTPAADMGPGELTEAASRLAEKHGGECYVVAGDDLLMENYPAVHAVGRASINLPRLFDMTWGNPEHPKVTLVGKGVCFDTGGLDIKPSAAMLKMKKDMGGAASVIAIASMIMELKLPVRLRLLIPAVENSVSHLSYRPGDVLQSRKGLTIEVGNTDAEGRIILCDALTEADVEGPDLLIDMATLTGAARVALGTDLPALFTNDDRIMDELAAGAFATSDPMWRMPLHQDYVKLLKSRVADLNNVSDGPFGGAITAALFLQHFVTRSPSWVHIDTYGWNDSPRPGRPVGGHALGALAVFDLIRRRFAAD